MSTINFKKSRGSVQQLSLL